MSDFLRGTVKRVTFEIEYPDGSRKVADVPDPEGLAMIIFDASRAPTGDASLFDVSESDWKLNPSVLVYPKRTTDGSEDVVAMPFCTHNGCKPPPPPV